MVDYQIRIYLCLELNFVASPFQQETADDGKYFSTEDFDFKLHFETMIGAGIVGRKGGDYLPKVAVRGLHSQF